MKVIVDLFNQHSGDLDLLRKMALIASQSGADYVKIQLLDSQQIWGDNSRKYLEMSREDFHRFVDFCENLDIKWMATAFTEEMHVWVRERDPDMYKIASVSVKNNREFVSAVLSEGKTTLVSNGFSPSEVLFSDFSNVIRLFCVSKYPTLLDDSALCHFPDRFGLNENFGGFSDHTLGPYFATKALLAGAVFLEKHFSLEKACQRVGELGHLCSFDERELRDFSSFIRFHSIATNQRY